MLSHVPHTYVAVQSRRVCQIQKVTKTVSATRQSVKHHQTKWRTINDVMAGNYKVGICIIVTIQITEKDMRSEKDSDGLRH